MKHLWILILFFHGVSGGGRVTVYVMLENSVTLPTGVQINQQDEITWYFNNTRIAQIIGDQSKICTDDQCDERFRDRLKLDHQTGSLTIMNTTVADNGGEYKLQINSSSRFTERNYTIVIYGLFVDESVSVSVMEGDSVTLNTGVQTNQQEDITWYYTLSYNWLIPIAKIFGNQSEICTNDPCDERFRDRLKLDHQTGSLTIMNITAADAIKYKLKIRYSNIITIYNETYFNFTVHGVSADEREEMKTKSVKEGESVTLDPGVTQNPNDVMKWYFNDILITEITGDQSKICTDDQCDERFRDRLKLDHQTGSLTIMNTRITDEGEYKLEFNSRFSITRSFSVSLTGSVLSSAALAGIIAVVLLIFVAVVAAVVSVIYCRKCKRRKINSRRKHNQNEQKDSCLMTTTSGNSARENSS